MVNTNNNKVPVNKTDSKEMKQTVKQKIKWEDSEKQLIH